MAPALTSALSPCPGPAAFCGYSTIISASSCCHQAQSSPLGVGRGWQRRPLGTNVESGDNWRAEEAWPEPPRGPPSCPLNPLLRSHSRWPHLAQRLLAGGSWSLGWGWGHEEGLGELGHQAGGGEKAGPGPRDQLGNEPGKQPGG